jgi:WD40 repeat protein
MVAYNFVSLCYFTFSHCALGSFTIINAISMEIIREDRKAKQYITDIKFSPNSIFFAMSSYDGRTYIHDASSFEFKFQIETSSKNCSISKIDFSTDSKFLRIETNHNELFYYQIEGSNFINTAVTLRDTEWENPTCLFSWNTQGK